MGESRSNIVLCSLSAAISIRIQWPRRVSGSGGTIGEGLTNPEGPQPYLRRAEAGMGFLGRRRPRPQQFSYTLSVLGGFPRYIIEFMDVVRPKSEGLSPDL